MFKPQTPEEKKIDRLEIEITSLEEDVQALEEELTRLRAENEALRTGDTCARQCEGQAYRFEARQQRRRADALAATIRALQDVVTHDGETKADFVARVRAILGADPDERLHKEHEALRADAERYRWLRAEQSKDLPLSSVVWKFFGHRPSGEWVNLIDGHDLDKHVDAAMREGK